MNKVEEIDPKLKYMYNEIKSKSISNEFRYESKQLLKPLLLSPWFQLGSDEETIVTIMEDRIQLIDYKTGKLLKSFNEMNDNENINENEDKDVLTNFVTGSNRDLVVVASSQMMMKQWDLKTFECVHIWKSTHKRIISAMAIDKTDTLLATGSSDKSIKVWDLNKKFYTHNLKTGVGLVTMLKFHSNPNHIWLISAHDDCNIRIWDLYSRSCIVQFESHTSSISNIEFLNDGISMVSFGRDSLINIWNTEQLSNEKIINYPCSIEYGKVLPPSYVKQLDLDITNAYVLVCNSNGVLEIYQLNPFEKKFEFGVSFSSCSMQFCQFLDSEKCTILLATSDLDILCVSLKSKQIISQFTGNLNEATDLKFINKNKIAIASTVENIKIFSILNDNLICDQIIYGHKETVMSLDRTKDEQFLVSASKDNTIGVWKYDITTHKYSLYAMGTSHMHVVSCIAISKSSPYFIVSGSEDQTVKKWSIKSVKNEVISPDWTGHVHSKGVNYVAISPNNEIIASCSQDKSIVLWNVEGNQLNVLEGHKRPVNCIDFSRNDKLLVSGSTDNTIMLWSISNFTCLKTFEGHTSSVTCVKFTNKGSQIFSSSSDGLIKIWSLQSYKCLNTLDGHDDKLWCFDCQNTDRIVSADAGGVVVLWDDVTLKKYEEQQVKKMNEIENDQKLENLTKEGNYLDAVVYAIELNKSRKVLHLFQTIIAPTESIGEGVSAIKSVLSQLDSDQITFLSKMVNEWNTHSKYFIVAQIVLKSLIEITPLDSLQNVVNLDSLITYSERHIKRINKIHESSHLFGLSAAFKKHGITSDLTDA